MRNGTWLIVALMVASSGCAGRGWTGKTAAPEDAAPTTASEMLTRKSEATARSAKHPTIATVSHTEPIPIKRSKKSGDEEEKEGGGFTKRYSQARSLESANKLDEAREIYQQLITENPDRWEPYHRLGLVADRQRRYTEAESLLSEALRRKPFDAELFGDLGYCYYLQGKLDKSESALSKAIAMKPSDGRYRNNLGLVYGAKGRDDDALGCFRKAGSEADAQYNMAFLMAMRNDMEGAKKRFQMALNADPNHDGARKSLRSFEQADRDGDENVEAELTADGRPWEPYIEGVTPLGNSTNATATHALQTRARNMVKNKLADKPGR